MTTTIIIQARIGSSRMPGKVLLPLPTKRSVLEMVHFAARSCEETVIACPAHDLEIFNSVYGWNKQMAFIGWDGDENDVLGRYAYVASKIKADPIVRVTADCPLIDPDTISECIELHRRTKADYTSNVYPARHFPKGWDVEVFSRDLLERANREAPAIGTGTMAWDDTKSIAADSARYDREHVTPWMQRECSAGLAKMALLKAAYDRSNERMTLDTIDDYRQIWEMLREAD